MLPRYCLAVLLAVAAMGVGSAPSGAVDATVAWSAASPSVVSVLPTWPGHARPGFGAPAGTAPEGTGVAILEPGLVITAAHVVARARLIEIRDHAGKRHKAEILAIDPDADLALLSTGAPVPPIEVSQHRPPTGTPVCLIANAFGLDLGITCGVVSAQARSGIGFNRVEDFIQTDAAANPGSSGGALVDLAGRLVGMASAIFTKESDANAGVNFAVSSELLMERVDRMRDRIKIAQ